MAYDRLLTINGDLMSDWSISPKREDIPFFSCNDCEIVFISCLKWLAWKHGAGVPRGIVSIFEQEWNIWISHIFVFFLRFCHPVSLKDGKYIFLPKHTFPIFSYLFLGSTVVPTLLQFRITAVHNLKRFSSTCMKYSGLMCLGIIKICGNLGWKEQVREKLSKWHFHHWRSRNWMRYTLVYVIPLTAHLNYWHIYVYMSIRPKGVSNNSQTFVYLLC